MYDGEYNEMAARQGAVMHSKWLPFSCSGFSLRLIGLPHFLDYSFQLPRGRKYEKTMTFPKGGVMSKKAPTHQGVVLPVTILKRSRCGTC